MNKPYVYKKTIVATGKSYIGQHCGKDPKYKGSGTLYKKDFFKYVKNRDKDLLEEVLEIVEDSRKLKEREEYWLNYYDARKNPMFYNMTNKAHGGNRIGHKHTTEAKKKNRDSHIGKIPWNKGVPMKESTKNKFRKKVMRFSLKGEFIEEYDSLEDAVKSTDSHKSDISSACCGRIHTAVGSIWILSNEFCKDVLSKKVLKGSNKWRSLRKKVNQICPTTKKILNTYNSCAQAERELGLTDVASAARGVIKIKGGFVWEYV